MTRPVEYGFVGRHTEYIAPKPSSPCPANGNESDLPDGYLEYTARQAVRDLSRLYGFEGARALIAGYLMDECERGVR